MPKEEYSNSQSYKPEEVEKKWQDIWKSEDIYKTPDNVDSKKKLVCLINVSLPIWRSSYWALVCICTS